MWMKQSCARLEFPLSRPWQLCCGSDPEYPQICSGTKAEYTKQHSSVWSRVIPRNSTSQEPNDSHFLGVVVLKLLVVALFPPVAHIRLLHIRLIVFDSDVVPGVGRSLGLLRARPRRVDLVAVEVRTVNALVPI